MWSKVCVNNENENENESWRMRKKKKNYSILLITQLTSRTASHVLPIYIYLKIVCETFDLKAWKYTLHIIFTSTRAFSIRLMKMSTNINNIYTFLRIESKPNQHMTHTQGKKEKKRENWEEKFEKLFRLSPHWTPNGNREERKII